MNICRDDVRVFILLYWLPRMFIFPPTYWFVTLSILDNLQELARERLGGPMLYELIQVSDCILVIGREMRTLLTSLVSSTV